jgi:hypothetical protein
VSKLVAIIEQQVVQQLVVRRVEIPEDKEITTESWDQLESITPDQKIILSILPGSKSMQPWGSPEMVSVLATKGATPEHITSLNAIHPRDLTILSVIAAKTGVPQKVKKVLLSTLTPLAQAIGEEILSPGSTAETEIKGHAESILKMLEKAASEKLSKKLKALKDPVYE